MRRGVIDGDRWISQRLAFLRSLLTADLPTEQRAAIEAEIEALRTEPGIHHGAPGVLWFWRRWVARRTRGIRRRPPDVP